MDISILHVTYFDPGRKKSLKEYHTWLTKWYQLTCVSKCLPVTMQQ